MSQNVLRRDFMVKPSESDAQQQLPLTMFVSQMIDLATDHANLLGIGFLNLESRGIGWILSRLSVEMSRWPKTGEKYILSTWIESYNAHFSERCFSVEDENGKILGYGRTIWVIIELETHKSVGTAGTVMPEEMIAGLHCPIPKFMRHKTFQPEKEVEYIFKYTDLDFYRHVNTVRYIQILLNQFTLEDFDTHLLSRFDIAFAHESKYGESALIKIADEESTTPGLLNNSELISWKRLFDISVGEKQILNASIVMSK